MKQETIDDPVAVVPRLESQPAGVTAGVTAANQDSRSNMNKSHEPLAAAPGWWCLDCETAAGEHCWADHALMNMRGALRRRLHAAMLCIADQLKAVDEDVYRLGREEHVAAALQVLSGNAATCHLTLAVNGGDTLSGSWRLPHGDHDDAAASLQRVFLALLAARGCIATEEVVFLGTRPPPRAAVSAVPASTTPQQTARQLGPAPASHAPRLRCDAGDAEGSGLGRGVASQKRKRGAGVDASQGYSAGAAQLLSGRPPAKESTRNAKKKKSWAAKRRVASSSHADDSEVPRDAGWCTIPACRAEMSSWESHVEHHMIAHRLPQHFCHLCLGVFRSAKVLGQHKRQHAKGFQCQHCEAQFVQERLLNKHITRFHYKR